ncbi:ABC1 family-domain-containing protein [Trametes meyenii]|nr:ABC1 family-domain-containing protein [Trametes meyenii]
MSTLLRPPRRAVHATSSSALLTAAFARPTARARLVPAHRPAHPRAHASSSAATPPPARPRRYARRTAFILLGLGLAYEADRQFNASAIGRNLRTLWTCLVIALDYKLNFKPEKAHEIPALQERVAERVYNLLTSNGGLYIKIGQAIGNNAALLPKPLQEKFASLFDDAPQVPYAVVDAVFRAEFGRPPAGPDGVFEVFEERAAASASIAQVHRAKLKTPAEDGSEQWVAVKIQKPDVSRQVEWDLAAFRAVMWVYENYLFDLPVYFVVDFITDHLRRELDFSLEAANAQRTASFIADSPTLAGRVYIPRVFPELSTSRVLVAEWIDGVRLSDRRAIARLMGDSPGPDSTPAVAGTNSPDSNAAPARTSEADRFPRLRGGTEWVMRTMVELFSAQIFDWGWVHCDPHPGNIIIRPRPDSGSGSVREPQFVLLDHGLYVRLSPSFQAQYARLWKGLLTLDYAVVRGVASEWGIGMPDLFASATLMRPVRFAQQGAEGLPDFERMDEYERGVAMKARLKGFLTDTDKMPKELVFIGRNMRIVQGNNQSFGSPVNRIRITGEWAARSLLRAHARDVALSPVRRLRELVSHALFRAVMFTSDVLFWIARARQWFWRRFGSGRVHGGEGFEDELERTMRNFAKANFGVDIPQNVFEG